MRPRGDIGRDRAVLGRLLDRLALTAGLISPIQAHARAVGSSSERLGLVSPADAGHVVARHSADSLLFALVRRPAPGERWVDVGSGAGFPGVVLACCFPDSTFTLVEPLKRRAGFLDLMMADLGLVNVEVVPKRLEQISRGGFDVGVARAFAEPMKALRSLLRTVRPDGQAIVSVSKNTSLDQDAALVAIEDIEDVDSPGLFSMMTHK